MDEKNFWLIIESINVSDNDSIVNIRNQLIKLSEEDIVKFEEILNKKIIEADHFNVMIAQKIMTG